MQFLGQRGQRPAARDVGFEHADRPAHRGVGRLDLIGEVQAYLRDPAELAEQQ